MIEGAALYTRVSTSNQEKRSSSPEMHLENCREYAREKGYKILTEETDVISGVTIDSRPGFNRILSMVSAGIVDVAVVDVVDRLGRGRAIDILENDIRRAGGRVEYVTTPRDASTTEGKILKHVDALTSDIERDHLSRRTKEGKREFANKGRVIASPFRPYGYHFHSERDDDTGKKISCVLIVDDQESEIVKQIFEWCTYEGASSYAIAKRLTNMGVLRMSDKEPNRKRKRKGPGQWHQDTVHGMLTNSTYKGEWRFEKNKVEREELGGKRVTHVKPRDPSEHTIVEVPKIVDPDLWELAQRQLQENKKRNFKNLSHHYMLRGFIRCGQCGAAMTGHTRISHSKRGVSKNWHYRCVNKYKYGVKSPDACKVRNINGPLIEGKIWSKLTELLLDEERLFREIDSKRSDGARARKVIGQQINSLEIQIQKNQYALDNLIDLFVQGRIDMDQYDLRKAKFEQAILEWQLQINESKKHLEDRAVLSPDREAELRKLRRSLAPRLENATFDQKRQLLDLLHVEFVYYDSTGELLMTGVFGSQSVISPEVENGVTSPEACACFRRVQS